LLSFVALLVIHLNFSYPTLPPGHFLPDPFCRVYVARIHKDKHGSNSGAYDNEGRFMPQKFEDIFAKYAESGGNEQDGLTLKEVLNLMKGQRLVWDIFGWCGFIFECEFTILWSVDVEMIGEANLKIS
jgi:peroxygenase